MAEINSNIENNVIKRKGMVLPFEPLSLAFDHMNYYVDMPAVSHMRLQFCHRLIIRPHINNYNYGCRFI